MKRERISTTVDGWRIHRCRELLGLKDSQLFDRALEALIEQVESHQELAALDAQPYEDDPDLMWEAPPGPDLPYDGEVPSDVRRAAAKRRRRA